MITLGINAAYPRLGRLPRPSTAACVAAAEEERFTRIKHGKRPVPFSTWELPFHAIDYCLAEAGIDLADVDHVAYSLRPAAAAGRTASTTRPIALPLEPSAHPAKRALGQRPGTRSSSPRRQRAAPARRRRAAPPPRSASRRASATRHWRWHFVEHHLAHAASAFLASPFERCAVMTLDGRGERATTSYGRCRGRPTTSASARCACRTRSACSTSGSPLTSASCTRRDEYKVMALASLRRAGLPVRRSASIVARRRRRPVHDRADADLAERVRAAARARRADGAAPLRHRRSLQVVLEETVLELAALAASDAPASATSPWPAASRSTAS